MSRPPQYYRRRWLVRIAVWTVFAAWFLPHLLRQDGAWAFTLAALGVGLALQIRQSLTRPAPLPAVTPVDRIRDDGLQSWHDAGQNRETRYRRERLAH